MVAVQHIDVLSSYCHCSTASDCNGTIAALDVKLIFTTDYSVQLTVCRVQVVKGHVIAEPTYSSQPYFCAYIHCFQSVMR